MSTGTLCYKILSAHLCSGTLAPGETISIRIDQTLTQDATGTLAYLELEAMKTPRVKTEVSLSYVDHNMQQNGPENQNDHVYLQTIAAQKGVIFSRPGNGICHQLHLERFGVPGKTLLGSDSHTPTGGGIGMIAIGAGGLDVARAMAGVPFSLTAPRVIGVRLTGALRPFVAAKDVILHLLSILKTRGNVGTAVEYFGPGAATLSVPERATITNMGAELGVTFSLFASDAQTERFLKAQKRGEAFVELQPDDQAQYERVIDIDLSALVPLAAAPSSPDNIIPVDELKDRAIGQVLIGSCTNSSYCDLLFVSRLVKGKRVHPNVSAAIAPGSRQVLQMLARAGALTDLIDAGFRILESACGPCIGQGSSPADGTLSLRTFNRNFPGRSGTRGDQVYLVSPATAALAALNGKIVPFDEPKKSVDYPPLPDAFYIDDALFSAPSATPETVDIIRKPTLGNPPQNTPMPDTLDGVVLIKLGDNITTDHISPAGIYLKYRSNIPRYAQVVFEAFNTPGAPTFAERASAVRDRGQHGIILAGLSYGQGSSREHAALCPMYLGVKAVIARSFERIHSANLINFGILPLQPAHDDALTLLEEGDSLSIEALHSHLRENEPLFARTKNGTLIELRHTLNAAQIHTVLCGGVLNEGL